MELALNVFWLVIAAVSVALWRPLSSPLVARFRHRIRPPKVLTALICALAILFPSISITDDLHAEQLVLEYTNPFKQTLKNSQKSHGFSGLGKFNPPAAQAAHTAPSLFFNGLAGHVAPFDETLQSQTLLSCPESRAPPSVS